MMIRLRVGATARFDDGCWLIQCDFDHPSGKVAGIIIPPVELTIQPGMLMECEVGKGGKAFDGASTKRYRLNGRGPWIPTSPDDHSHQYREVAFVVRQLTPHPRA